MSLFKKTAISAGIEAEKNATDDTLLALAMGCIAFADGPINPSEVSTIEAFASTLPEFANGGFVEPWTQSTKIFNKHKGNANACIEELKKLSTPSLKKKAFILAVDVAFASNDVNETEDKLLDKMKSVLGIDDLFAERAVAVLATKYSSR